MPRHNLLEHGRLRGKLIPICLWCICSYVGLARADDKPDKIDYRKLVQGLVSPNKPPKRCDPEDRHVEYPADYDRKAQAAIAKNRQLLFEHCEEALPALQEGSTDERYSLTWSTDSFVGNACVGEVCLQIVRAYLEVYRDDMKGVDKKRYGEFGYVPTYHSAVNEQVSKEKKEEVRNWWPAHKHIFVGPLSGEMPAKPQRLIDLQLEAYDWAALKVFDEAHNSVTDEFTKLADARGALAKSGKVHAPHELPHVIGVERAAPPASDVEK